MSNAWILNLYNIPEYGGEKRHLKLRVFKSVLNFFGGLGVSFIT